MSLTGEDMERFLSDVAHDLRNLHEGTRTALFPGEADSELKSAFDREVQELVRKVETIADLSRLRGGRWRLRKATMALSSLSRSTVEKLSPFLETRKVRYSDARDEAVALADRGAAEKIVSATIHAAARLTCEGDSIWLETRASSGRAILEVRFPARPDSAERLPRFFALEEGWLGSLGVAKDLARLSGGDVSWDTRSDEVRLIASFPAAPEPRSSAEHAGTKLSILVVDDGRDSAMSLAMLLSVAGHETDVRHDGRSALEAVRSRPRDVVLLDIGLPDVDGYEVCRTLRASPDTRSTLLVAVSGRGDDEARKLSLDAGFDAHLLKPIAREELDELLRRLATNDGQ